MKIKLERSKYDFKSVDEDNGFKDNIKKILDINIEKFQYNPGLKTAFQNYV